MQCLFGCDITRHLHQGMCVLLHSCCRLAEQKSLRAEPVTVLMPCTHNGDTVDKPNHAVAPCCQLKRDVLIAFSFGITQLQLAMPGHY